MYFTTLWSKEREDDCFFKSDKSFAVIWRDKKVDSCYLEPQICISQLFGARKERMTAFSIRKNWFTAIWSMKKMDPSYLEVEKTGSQLFRARKTVFADI